MGTQALEHALDDVVGDVVGRIEQDQVVRRARRRRWRRARQRHHVAAEHLRTREPHRGHVGAHHLERLAVAFDEEHVSGPARQGLKPQGTGSGVQVCGTQSCKGAQVRAHRTEHGFPHAIGRRSGAGARHCEPPPPCSARHDPRHGPLPDVSDTPMARPSRSAKDVVVMTSPDSRRVPRRGATRWPEPRLAP